MLSPGYQGSLSWKSGGKETASIDIEAEGSQVRLKYQHQGKTIALPVSVESTPVHFGGGREWFTCPKCARRCAILYAPAFACRLCLDLRYESQRTGRRFQPLKTVRRILDALGAADTLPPRPKGMHQRKYDGLCREYSGALHAFAGNVGAG